jgi:hypothetical protein
MFRVVLVVVAVLVVGGALRPSEVVGQEGLSISGVVWWDENGDGVRQPGEIGVVRRPVVLLGSAGLSRQIETDRDGRYVFSGLAAGVYTISLPEELSTLNITVLTFPESRIRPPFTRIVELAAGSIDGIDFGLGEGDPLPMFSGSAFINAAPVDRPRVRALIEGQDCTGPWNLIPPDLDQAFFWISVFSAEHVPGCGEAGDQITFTINGLVANETATWTKVPGGTAPLSERNSRLMLTVGAPFAVFGPRVEERDAAGKQVWGYGYTVAAMVSGQVCAVGLPRVWDSIMVIVPSETTKPGCGREGATVTFAVEGFAVSASRVWTAQPPAEYEELVLDLVKSETARLAGPRFAYYWIDLPEMVPTHPLFDEVEQMVIATIDGEYCGQARGVGPRRVLVAVAPAELREGCGRPGATVSFSQTDAPYATATWEPGFQEGPAAPGIAQAGALAPQGPAEVPSQQILPPSVGDGGLR